MCICIKIHTYIYKYKYKQTNIYIYTYICIRPTLGTPNKREVEEHLRCLQRPSAVYQDQSTQQMRTCKLVPCKAVYMQSSLACCHKPEKATWTADLCFLGRAELGPRYSMPAANTDETLTMPSCRATQILLSAVPRPQAQISTWATLARAWGTQCHDLRTHRSNILNHR